MENLNSHPLMGLFIIGLLGGVHCIGMCGALVTAFGISDFGPKSTRRLLTLNLGRLCTYMLLGGIVGGIGHGVSALFQISVVLYCLAQVMLIGLGLYLAGWHSFIPFIEKQGKYLWQSLQPVLGKHLPPRNHRQTFVTGLLWGFIPCGLVYSALTTALFSGSPLKGGSYMLAFWLGTLPNLLVIGRFSMVLRHWMQKPAVKKVAGAMVCLLGAYGLSKVLF